MGIIHLEPIDFCGCGDTGYLIKQTVRVPLAEGTGEIFNVPVYKCSDPECTEFNLPTPVARRIDEIAEDMEKLNLTSAEFKWESHLLKGNDSIESSSIEASGILANLESLTLQLINQEFEDAKVIFVIPGDIVFFQHRLDPTEFYALRIERQFNKNHPHFSLAKFYLDENGFDYDLYLEVLDEGKVKEIGTITFEEFESALEDEFGEKL